MRVPASVWVGCQCGYFCYCYCYFSFRRPTIVQAGRSGLPFFFVLFLFIDFLSFIHSFRGHGYLKEGRERDRRRMVHYRILPALLINVCVLCATYTCLVQLGVNKVRCVLVCLLCFFTVVQWWLYPGDGRCKMQQQGIQMA